MARLARHHRRPDRAPRHAEGCGGGSASGGFTHVVLLGMGGSSLCPEVWATFGACRARRSCSSSTRPIPRRSARSKRSVDLARTLFVVSSKSGSTLEPNILKDVLLRRVKPSVGAARRRRRFVAITDPARAAGGRGRANGFRRVFSGAPAIGGRFSALSDFGMVRPRSWGSTSSRLLAHAQEMVEACAAATVPRERTRASCSARSSACVGRRGRDKLTIVASPGDRQSGRVARAARRRVHGQGRKGIIPVDGEPLGRPTVYGDDRRVRLPASRVPGRTPRRTRPSTRSSTAGQPVVRIASTAVPTSAGVLPLGDRDGGRRLRAGHQPVRPARRRGGKVATRTLTDAVRGTGALPAEKPIFDGGRPLAVRRRDERELHSSRPPARARRWPGILARAPRSLGPATTSRCSPTSSMNAGTTRVAAGASRSRCATRRASRRAWASARASCTRRARLQGRPEQRRLPADHVRRRRTTCRCPATRYTFGVVKAAQARGDFEVLAERGRRALRATSPAIGLGPRVAAARVAPRPTRTRALAHLRRARAR